MIGCRQWAELELRLISFDLAAEAHNTSPRLGIVHTEVVRIMDGFQSVLAASKVARDAQKAYFKARKAGNSYDATKLLDESKKAEKILDDLVKFWTSEMAPMPAQATLF